jgi:hypothetical protein
VTVPYLHRSSPISIDRLGLAYDLRTYEARQRSLLPGGMLKGVEIEFEQAALCFYDSRLFVQVRLG